MITQELVSFIKQQLEEGKSKEEIAGILTPHGWQLVDINSAFAQLVSPVTPPAVTSFEMPSIQPTETYTAPVTAMNTQSQVIMPASTDRYTATEYQPLSASSTADTMTQFVQPAGMFSSPNAKKIMIAAAVVVGLGAVGFAGYYAVTNNLLPEKITNIFNKKNTEEVAMVQNDFENQNQMQTQAQDQMDNQSAPVITSGEEGLEMPITNSAAENDIEKNGTETGSSTTTSASTTVVTNTKTTKTNNPDFSHVKDSFSATFPLPKEEDVITATVLSATTFENIRYILEYSTKQSITESKKAIKASLVQDGYTVSINEGNPDFQIIMASKVFKNPKLGSKSYRITLEKNPVDVIVKAVFSQ